MSLHKEINLEQEICDDLKAADWLYAEGDAAKYDRARALFPEDLVEWIKGSQPKSWEAIEKNHGAHAQATILDRVREQLNARGTIEVLRQGIDVLGMKDKLKLAQFKPALVTGEIIARYQQNRLRVVRQVRYSGANENCIDLVLFLNGIAVATAELKSNFTQSVKDAIDQYKFDRNPRPKGLAAEPLLTFLSGALVHFAVSNAEVYMTTKLDGPATSFLPFNQGDGGAAGNPLNTKGHRTDYLWKQVWQRDSWLEILGKYIVGSKDKKKQVVKLIFPRYHQLDATRKLVTAVLQDGPGAKYLIQHSAGSGKTNSIAWTAHFLADLHDANNKKVFDSVLVISDRTVIDTQLQEAIFDFERTTGVVATIKGEGGSKSAELAQALSGAKKVVVCTIQTFPFALKEVRKLAASEGKRFAVIADEAHSSQTGDSAVKLKATLSAEEMAELQDGGEISVDDVLAAQMAERADSEITYVAFTATPKTKTMEIFGTRPDPTRKPAKDNVPAPFHVYSMRQAIEEGFILDVLKNYTSYRLAFKLTHGGKEWDDKEVEKSEAMKGIMGWIRLHPYNISQKVEIIVEHFREFVAPLLGGRAKAMVVVGSRVEAVRWQLAINTYIRKRAYPMRTLVAFSGDVTDKESGPDDFSETSVSLNPGLKGQDIRTLFATDEYQILLVANKFQTGFDQPLLCGMYVDRKLADIQAVQTLSRLNRCYPGKDTTYVLDFYNKPEDVLEAFKKYFETAELAGVTDSHIVFSLRAKLDAQGHYDDDAVARVVAVLMDPAGKQSALEAAIAPVAKRLVDLHKAARARLKAAIERKDEAAAKDARDEMKSLELFKSDMGAYVRMYTYLSQIFDYGNTDMEKRNLFYKVLIPLLEFGREREGIDTSSLMLTHHNLRNKGKQAMTLGGEAPKLMPLTEIGGGEVRDPLKAHLSAIIEKVNELFEGELTDDDKLVYVNNVLMGKLLESEKLRLQAKNNTKEQFANSPDLRQEIVHAVMAALEAHEKMSTQALNSDKVREGLKDVLLNEAGLWEALRGEGA